MVDLIVLGVVLLLGPWILIGVLFVRTSRIQVEIRSLREALRRPVEEKGEGREAEPAAPAEEEETGRRTTTGLSEAIEGSGAPQAKGAPEAVSVTKAEEVEKSLTSRWLVWLGAVAISLAGVFFIAYAIEQGWLGPTTRIVLGFVFGLALTIAGEWVRRRPFEQTIASVRPDYVPPALSSAGIFTLYASAYVGNALYSLYPPFFAFLLLACIGLFAVALSLLQGRFVALLGLLGSFLTPLLVPSDTPSAWTLFPYLLAIVAASLAVVRYKGWWPLGYLSLSLATVWCLFWLVSVYAHSDAVAIGGYILLVCASYQLVRFGHSGSGRSITAVDDIQRIHPSERVGWAGFLAAALMIIVFVRADNYGTIALSMLAVFALGGLWTARRHVALDLVSVLVAIVVLLLFASWHIVEITHPERWWISPEITEFGQPRGPLLPPELQTYSLVGAIFSGLFGIGGFVALWGARRVSLFAGTSAIIPVIVLAIAYWRFLEFGHDLRWAGVSVALALVALFAASTVEKYRDREELLVALGLYAAAVVAFLSLGFAMTLREGWLTVALSLQLPALAWIHKRLNVNLLRAIAAVVTVIVLVRLVFNPNIFDYPIESGGLFNWVLYAYGIPCIAFFWSARTFSKSSNDLLVAVLEASALVFGVLLVSYEIRLTVTGSLIAPYDSLFEQSLQSIAWLALAYGLLVRGKQIQISKAPILTGAAYILLALAAVQVLLIQVFLNSPVHSLLAGYGEWTSVGRWPVLNLLLLAYLVPAAFAFAFVPAFVARGRERFANISGGIGLFLVLVFISLEVKHWFQGEFLKWAFVSDAENYAISVAWLVYALSLLASGILLRKSALRYGSLVVLLIAVLKVFVGDMAGLTGLYRVGSFLGLGFCLVGIGYIYQRFVFAEAAKPPTGTVDAK